MTEKELTGKTVKELRDSAKEFNITGRWDMNKTQLIEAILNYNGKNTDSTEEQVKDNIESSNCECEKENEKVPQESKKQQKVSAYVGKIKRGMLVAFRYNGRLKSAKVVEKSTKRKKLKLETKVGIIYVVSFDDVAWVKTGARWPKGVYKLLKSGVRINEDQQEC